MSEAESIREGDTGILKVGSCNLTPLWDPNKNDKRVRIINEFLRHHYLRKLFTISRPVPMRLLSMAYQTSSYDVMTDCVEFQVTKRRSLQLRKPLFCEILEIDYDAEKKYVDLKDDELIDFIKSLGYNHPDSFNKIGQFRKKGLPIVWEHLFFVLVRCLSGKIGSMDSGSKGMLMMLYGFHTGADIDYGTILWHDFKQHVMSKNPLCVPHHRFWSVILVHMCERHKIPIDEEGPMMPQDKAMGIFVVADQSRFTDAKPVPDAMLDVIPIESEILREYRELLVNPESDVSTPSSNSVGEGGTKGKRKASTSGGSPNSSPAKTTVKVSKRTTVRLSKNSNPPSQSPTSQNPSTMSQNMEDTETRLHSPREPILESRNESEPTESCSHFFDDTAHDVETPRSLPAATTIPWSPAEPAIGDDIGIHMTDVQVDETIVEQETSEQTAKHDSEPKSLLSIPESTSIPKQLQVPKQTKKQSSLHRLIAKKIKKTWHKKQQQYKAQSSVPADYVTKQEFSCLNQKLSFLLDTVKGLDEKAKERESNFASRFVDMDGKLDTCVIEIEEAARLFSQLQCKTQGEFSEGPQKQSTLQREYLGMKMAESSTPRATPTAETVDEVVPEGVVTTEPKLKQKKPELPPEGKGKEKVSEYVPLEEYKEAAELDARPCKGDLEIPLIDNSEPDDDADLASISSVPKRQKKTKSTPITHAPSVSSEHPRKLTDAEDEEEAGKEEEQMDLCFTTAAKALMMLKNHATPNEDTICIGPFCVRTTNAPTSEDKRLLEWIFRKQHVVEEESEIASFAGCSFPLDKKEIYHLYPGSLLSNYIINFVVEMLCVKELKKRNLERWYFVVNFLMNDGDIQKNCLLYPKDIKKLQSVKQLFFPIGKNEHFFLIVVKTQEKVMEVWDTSKKSIECYKEEFKNVFTFLDKYIHPQQSFLYIKNVVEIHQQENNYDCGVFLCYYLEFPEDVHKFLKEKWFSDEERCQLSLRILNSIDNQKKKHIYECAERWFKEKESAPPTDSTPMSCKRTQIDY